MDYGGIINDAFRLAWQKKSLWVYGLFAGGGAIGAMNFSIDEEMKVDLQGFGGGADFGQAFDTMPWLAPALFAMLAIIGISHLLLIAISQPALIDAVNRLTRGGTYRFTDSLSVGVSLMLRTLALMILEIFAMVGAVGVVVALAVLSGILAALIHWLLVLPVVLIGLAAFVAVLFVGIMIFGFAYRAMVVRDAGILDGLNEGAVLFRQRKRECLGMFAIFFMLWIMTAIAASIISYTVGVPLYLLAKSLGIGLIPMILMAMPILWAVMLPLNGFLGAAFDAAFTLFYFRLLEPQQMVAVPYGTQPGQVAP